MAARRRLPPLNALKAFECAGRLGSFTAAGEELCVSAGAISRHVAILEDFLGQRMFKRGHNEVTLTPAGRAYLGRIQEAMDGIEDASSRDAAAPAPRRLLVNALPTFTERWLLPRLQGFLDEHPGVSVRISTAIEETDWDSDRADVSVYASEEGWPDRGQRLFETSVVPVGAPGLAARLPRPWQPHDLAQEVLISSVNKRADWQRWLYAAGLRREVGPPQLQTASSALAYAAAVQGLGLVCAEREFIAQDLAQARLVALSDLAISGNSYFVESHPGRKPSALAERFTQWLVAQAA